MGYIKRCLAHNVALGLFSSFVPTLSLQQTLGTHPKSHTRQPISIELQLSPHLMSKMMTDMSGLSTFFNPALCANTEHEPCQEKHAALACSGCYMVQVCLPSFKLVFEITEHCILVAFFTH